MAEASTFIACVDEMEMSGRCNKEEAVPGLTSPNSAHTVYFKGNKF